MINQILMEVNAVGAQKNVLVVCVTNHAGIINPAVIRTILLYQLINTPLTNLLSAVLPS